MMSRATWKSALVSILPLALASVVCAQPAPAPAPFGFAADEPPEIESQVPGLIQLVRWDVLLNQSGADAVNKVAQPIQTASKVYQGLACSGFELRQAVADAIANQGVEQVSHQMVFGPSWLGGPLNLPNLYFNYYADANPKAARLSGGPQQTDDILARKPDDHLHIKLNESQFRVQISEGQRFTQLKSNPEPSIQYDGDLAAGDAVAFMWPITSPSKTVYYQLAVWESFKATNATAMLMQVERDSGWWCRNGPAKFRRWAAIAGFWESNAAHLAAEPPAEFVKKLDDGKELRLLALCRPDQAPFCWWDAQGKPVSGAQSLSINFEGDPPKGLWAELEVKGTGEELARQLPATRPMFNQFLNSVSSSYEQYAFTQIDDGATELKAGAAVGDWEELARMNVGESKNIDGITYTIQNAQNGRPSDYFNVLFKSSAEPENIVGISAVGPDGREANSYSNSRALVFSNSNQNNQMNYVAFNGIPFKDVQYFRLCQRKRQWVTFTGFVQQPLTPVKTDYTPDEIAAAAKAQQRKAQQTVEKDLQPVQRALRQLQSNQWNAIKPDPATQKGTLRILVYAATQGDEKTVRSLLIAKSPDENSSLNFYAHLITVTQSNFAKAAKLFGDAKTIDQLDNAALRDHGMLFMGATWDKQPDGTWIGSCKVTVRKDSSEIYRVDLEPLIQAHKDSMPAIQQTLATAEQISKLLDQPGVTLDQVKAALALPIP